LPAIKFLDRRLRKRAVRILTIFTNRLRGRVKLKIVIADSKSSHAFTREVPKEKEAQFIGRKIGDKVEGGLVGLGGYTLKITGGCDAAGFPMRSDIPGIRRTTAVIGYGVGRRNSRKGSLQKRTVSGNAVSQTTSLVNATITEYGAEPLEKLGFVYTPKVKGEKKAEEKK
jgi:small subunit ribosomal protein S6e